ncbi:MAG: hypothetical protein LBR53_03260 [Deltaproteobacteria bacterium]|jgi:hypothetical protein|nr:hypothetical protein [Deltaproteobacteria bacterium]
MNIMSTVEEIGILETLKVVAANNAGQKMLATHLPIVSKDYVEILTLNLAEALFNTGKRKLLLILPEIALLECLAEMNWRGKAIILLPFDMEVESKERIKSNIPAGIETEIIDEGAYPSKFRPDNGAIVCTGMIQNDFFYYTLPASSRMMGQYRQFNGEKLFLSCCPKYSKIPETGWTYCDRECFSLIMEDTL